MSSTILTNERLRELLIWSSDMRKEKYVDEIIMSAINSNDEHLLESLVKIASDLEDYGGYAPRAASYYLRFYPAEMLKPFEDELCKTFLEDDNGISHFHSIALGKLKSEKARLQIYEIASNDKRSENWIYKEAVKEYES